MTRTEFLTWALMIAMIFYLYFIGHKGLAFAFMSLYAIMGGILFKLKCDLLDEAVNLVCALEMNLHSKSHNELKKTE